MAKLKALQKLTSKNLLLFFLLGSLFLATKPAFAMPQNAPMILVSSTVLQALINDLVKNLPKSSVTISSLQNETADPHHSELRPSQMALLGKSKALIYHGNPFEPWLPIALINKVPRTLNLGDKCYSMGKEDPHVWVSSKGYLCYLNAIVEFLKSEPTIDQRLLVTNADHLKRDLEVITKEMDQLAKEIKDQKIKVTSEHAAYMNLFLACGLDYIPLNLNKELAELTPKAVSEVYKLLKTQRRVILFPEYGHDSSWKNIFENEAGVMIAPPLYSDVLPTEKGKELSYIAVFKKNFEIIQSLTSSKKKAM